MKEKSQVDGYRPQRIRHPRRGARRLPHAGGPDARDRGQALQGEGRPRVDAAVPPAVAADLQRDAAARLGSRPSRVWTSTTSRPTSGPNTKMQNDWKNVPQDIKDTFERLGIPQAERKSLAGVGAQYDSELVYHNVQGRGGRAGRCLHRYGERAEGRIRRHGAQVLHEARYAAATISSRRCTAQSGLAARSSMCRRACRCRSRCSRISA